MYRYGSPVGHNKMPCHNLRHDRALMVGVQGFEPRQAESESAVLPLDDTPMPRDGFWGEGPAVKGRPGPVSAGAAAWPGRPGRER